MLIVKYSSSAHELLLHLLCRSLTVIAAAAAALVEVTEELLELRAVERALDPEGPAERPATQCQLQALRGRVQMRPATGCPARGIGHQPVAGSLLTRDDSQQVFPGGPLPASDARAHAVQVLHGHGAAQPSVVFADRRRPV